MRLLSTVGPVLAAFVALSCRAQSSTSPSFSNGPVVLVSVDTPTELQRHLSAMTPARAADPTTSSRKLDGALDAFNARAKARRGYIAVDKPLYKPGETIWFRAFDLTSANLAGVEKDIVTFKLVSPRGSAVAERRVLVENGATANDFQLPYGMAGGEYTLVAETDSGLMKTERKVIVSSYQPPRIKKKLEFLRKAYGPGDTVTATVELHRATGEAMSAKVATGLATLDGSDLVRVPITTDAAGNAVVQFTLPSKIQTGDGLLTILVDDGGVTESVQKRIPIALENISLVAYPEGGDLVARLPSRVYFAAKNAMDKPADIEAKVTDDRGRTVALLRSYHDGMGRFELVPDPDRTYKIEITRPIGIAKTYPLPAAKREGCSLQSIDDYASKRADLRVAVWCTRDQDIVATAVLRDKRVATQATRVTASQPSVLAFAMPAGAQGAVRVTVFDDRLAAQAERLVYRNRGADLKIEIKPDKPTYTPRGRVTMEIEAKHPDGSPAAAADVALSVVDDTVLSFADDKQATMLARLYLEADMPGQKIEEPNFYFGPDAKAPAAIDLVLGTHGWRRFEWTPVLSAPPEKPIEENWAYNGDPFAPKKKPGSLRAKGAKNLAEPEPPPEAVEGGLPAQEENDVVVVEAKVAKPRIEAIPPRAADDDEAKPKKKMKARDEEEDEEPARGMDEREMVDAIAPAARWDREGTVADEEWGGEVAAARKNLEFDNRGFDVGVEAGRHRIQIRDKVVRLRDQADPYRNVVQTREFPVPSYTEDYKGPRTDFRETLFWAPSIATDAAGKARVTFSLSDEVTSFKAIAEGAAAGRLGRGEALVQSKKPVSLAVKLPLEVTAGDHIRLPVTIANETDRPFEAKLSSTFGKAFKITGGALPATITLAPNERRATFYELDVVGDGKVADDGKIALGVEAAHHKDDVEKTIVVAPVGFPQQVSLSGTLSGTIKRDVFIGDVMPGTMNGMVTLYPSPLATMVEGSEAMIAEPGGCFEQASSTNYPNIMILGYLEENKAASPQIAERANKALDKGYKLLTGYETKTKGYEWFGGDPGHEALSAYGLMEFADMKKVYGDVDNAMIKRTREWLRGRRDGTGGFQRNSRALDSFGRASEEVTNGYITYALTEAGEKDLGIELAAQAKIATTTKDPYLMAMATKSLVNAQPKDPTTAAAVKRLADMQTTDGSYKGATQSITMSGGEALDIESTAIAAMAMMSHGREYMPQVRKAVEWMNAHRSGFGGYGSTQSTVLALKAMTQYAKASRVTEASGTVILRLDGKEVKRVTYEKGHQGAIELPIGEHLRPGKNTIEITLESKEPLPYSGVVTWGSKVPASNPATKVALDTKLATANAKLGEGVRMNVRVTNTTNAGIPMTLARIGLPGGLTFQTWQLQELRDKGLIDFYETRPREVILYFRSMAPNASKQVPLELLASVPGTFTAPASRAYLYYTNEHKAWVAPSTIEVTP
jgi:hypothetical protein